MNNTEPTQEQLKKFWEWCELQCLVCGKIIAYGIPDKEYNCQRWKRELPALTLDNLFKYAVPKVKYFMLYDWGGEFQCNIYTHTSDNPDEDICKDFRALASTPELALFWAIWEIIKEG